VEGVETKVRKIRMEKTERRKKEEGRRR